MIGFLKRRRRQKSEDDPAWKPTPLWKKLLKGFMWFVLMDVLVFSLVTGWLMISTPRQEARLLRQWQEGPGGVDDGSIEADFPARDWTPKGEALVEACRPFGIYLKASEARNKPSPSRASWKLSSSPDIYNMVMFEGYVPTEKDLQPIRDYLSGHPEQGKALLQVATLPGYIGFPLDNVHPGEEDFRMLGLVYLYRLLMSVSLWSEQNGDRQTRDQSLDILWDVSVAALEHPATIGKILGLLGIRFHQALTRMLPVDKALWMRRYQTLRPLEKCKESFRREVWWNLRGLDSFVVPRSKGQALQISFLRSFIGQAWLRRNNNKVLARDLEGWARLEKLGFCKTQYDTLEKELAPFHENKKHLFLNGLTTVYQINSYNRANRTQYDLDLTAAVLQAQGAFDEVPGSWPRDQKELDAWVIAQNLPRICPCPEDRLTYTITKDGIRIAVEGPKNLYSNKRGYHLPLEVLVEPPKAPTP